MFNIPDYHIHTILCKHAAGEPEDYIECALSKGLGEIGFADHIPLPGGIDIKHRMVEEQLEKQYIERILKLKEEYRNRIEIKLGIEADYYPGTEQYVSEIIDNYPFDYVIGSVHFLNGWGFDSYDEIEKFHNRDLNNIYREYFSELRKLVNTGIFDIVGHFDVIKKFGFKPENGYMNLVEDLLPDLKKSKMVVEINTSGLRKPVKEIYPSEEILVFLHRNGIKFTAGSDAHDPEQVGYKFSNLISFLEKNNIENLERFEKREII